MLNVSKFCFVLSGAVSLLAMGCDDGGGTTAATGGSAGQQSTTGGSGGATGGTTGAPAGAVAVTPDATGWVDAANEGNTIGVQGAWYPYGDSYGDMKCTAAPPAGGGHMPTECSVITSPDPAVMSFPNTGGKMCVKGTVAKVLPKIGGTGPSDYDYANMWGAGIGFDLNVPKPVEGMPAPAKMPFDAEAKKVTGVSFKLEMPTTSPLRVEFATVPTEGDEEGSPYWGASPSWPSSPVVLAPGENVVTWDKVSQPGPAATAIAFDKKQLLSIQFHVPANTMGTTAFDFCVSDLKFLVSQ